MCSGTWVTGSALTNEVAQVDLGDLVRGGSYVPSAVKLGRSKRDGLSPKSTGHRDDAAFEVDPAVLIDPANQVFGRIDEFGQLLIVPPGVV